MKRMTRSTELIMSYLTMRRMIGVLGLGLPVIVVLGGFIQSGFTIQASISSYYFTNMHDFFVGILCSVSLFLISYKGYEIVDDIITNMSGVFALGIIAFPTSMFSGHIVRVGIFLTPDNISQYIHLAFATLFFVSLSFNSIFLFTRHGGAPSLEKKIRNTVYIVCGVVILFSVVCMIVYIAFFRNTWVSELYPVFVFETISTMSFGVSWLVKGNTLFRDRRRG